MRDSDIEIIIFLDSPPPVQLPPLPPPRPVPLTLSPPSLVADAMKIVNPARTPETASVRFQNWINLWYKLIREESDGRWCLLMGNCEGHKLYVTLSGAQILSLPPKSTTKHEPLNLGVIAKSKIRYRSS